MALDALNPAEFPFLTANPFHIRKILRISVVVSLIVAISE